MKQRLTSLWEEGIRRGAALACWRLPGDTKIHFLASFTGISEQETTLLEERAPGFLIAPFACSDFKEALYLKADLYQCLEGEEGIPLWPDHRPSPATSVWPPVSEGDSKEGFLQRVEASKAAIAKGTFEKLVPARTKRLSWDSARNPVSAFIHAHQTLPTAFISLTHTPQYGIWLGASPELLLTYDTEQALFRTVSLAGTRPIAADTPVEELSWRQKEIEEQALVSRFIVDCFKKIRLRAFTEHGPKTVRSGRFAHLMTDFQVSLKQVDYPTLASVMVNLLHPTSAVCGTPKEGAQSFLKKHEPFDRLLYTGYLGPVNIEKRIDLFVNIRCAQLHQNQALLYAGAGITPESIPEKEWLETELKCQTMQDILS